MRLTRAICWFCSKCLFGLNWSLSQRFRLRFNSKSFAGQKEVPAAGELGIWKLRMSLQARHVTPVRQDMASRIRAKEAELTRKQEAWHQYTPSQVIRPEKAGSNPVNLALKSSEVAPAPEKPPPKTNQDTGGLCIADGHMPFHCIVLCAGLVVRQKDKATSWKGEKLQSRRNFRGLGGTVAFASPSIRVAVHA